LKGALTDAEKDMIDLAYELAGKGILSRHMLARESQLTIHTIHVRLYRIFKKLQVSGLVQLVLKRANQQIPEMI